MANKICAICGQEITDESQMMPHKNRFVHARCFESVTSISEKLVKNQRVATEKKKQTKPRVPKDNSQIARPVSDQEYKEKQELYAYIENLTKTAMTVKAYKNIDDYVKKYNFTYAGILAAMRYYYDMLDNPVVGDGVGIIPYIYEEAQVYMNELEEVAKKNAAITSNELAQMYQPRVVHIVKPSAEVKGLIDLSKFK